VDTTRPQRKYEPRNMLKRDLEEEMWTASTAGGRWRWQHKTELDGDKWSVAYVPLGATRHKSSQTKISPKI